MQRRQDADILTCDNYSEALYEDDSFPERKLAALVLSKVYYHLQAYDESMFFALAAGDLFKLDNPGEFEETIISKCVDHYIAAKNDTRPSVVASSAEKDSLPALATAFSAGSGDGAASAFISPNGQRSTSMSPLRAARRVFKAVPGAISPSTTSAPGRRET